MFHLRQPLNSFFSTSFASQTDSQDPIPTFYTIPLNRPSHIVAATSKRDRSCTIALFAQTKFLSAKLSFHVYRPCMALCNCCYSKQLHQ